MRPPDSTYLAEVANEMGVDPNSVPPIERRLVELPGEQQLSLLAWGGGDPELVLLHGGGQNAHTWDLVLVLLGRPAIAIDLPGHGHSSWREDHDYRPACNADAVAVAIREHAPAAAAVIGMSLGGLTLISLAAHHPDLVRRAMLIDVTPGSSRAAARMSEPQRGAAALAGGPRTFRDRQDMVDAAVRASPRRSAAAVRRGVVHNSRRTSDGRWAWRYDDLNSDKPFPVDELWSDLGRLSMPTVLVVGGDSHYVPAADRAKIARLVPSIGIHSVDNAGHAVQSDQPAALAALISSLVPSPRTG